jgi:hypothetical protein
MEFIERLNIFWVETGRIRRKIAGKQDRFGAESRQTEALSRSPDRLKL